jgi:ABC-type nitrate/sulfonate/bicarbonate transport system permease component
LSTESCAPEPRLRLHTLRYRKYLLLFAITLPGFISRIFTGLRHGDGAQTCGGSGASR